MYESQLYFMQVNTTYTLCSTCRQ